MSRSLPLTLYLAQLRKSGRDPQAYGRDRKRPIGPLLWFHVDGSEDVETILQFAERLRMARDWVNVLITTSDPTTGPVQPDVDICFDQAPDEAKDDIAAFLSHWRPDICIWTQGYLRPGLLAEVSARKIPHYLINATSEALEARTWQWVPKLNKALLQDFDRLLASDEGAAQKLRKLGAPSWRIEKAGRLTEGSAALRCNEGERAAWVEDLGGRPLWLSAAVISEEMPLILKAHKGTRKFAHRLLLILVPDDPTQGDLMERQAIDDGWSVARRSKDDPVTEATDIYIADTRREMGLWFRLAPVSFLGGSLHPEGQGSNPTEPAALGSAILHGPHTGRYGPRYDALGRAGGALLVLNANALSKAVGALLSPDRTAEMAHAAWDISTKTAAVTERVQDLIFEALDALEDA